MLIIPGSSHTLFEFLEVNYDIKPSIEQSKECLTFLHPLLKKQFMTKFHENPNFLLKKRFEALDFTVIYA